MATITNNSITAQNGFLELTLTTLTGTDDFSQTNGILYIQNNTGGDLTINLLGDEISSPEYYSAIGDVDLSAGYDITVTDGTTVAQKLSQISDYLTGTTTVTGGTGATAWLVTVQ